jgi:hypothetical protein
MTKRIAEFVSDDFNTAFHTIEGMTAAIVSRRFHGLRSAFNDMHLTFHTEPTAVKSAECLRQTEFTMSMRLPFARYNIGKQ